MLRIAAQLRNWLHCHAINPRAITVTIRANDPVQTDQIKRAMLADAGFANDQQKLLAKVFQIHGINFMFTDLDTSASAKIK